MVLTDQLTMPCISNTTSEFPIFLLTGFPGLEAFHIWISILFFLLSTVVLLGNSMILLVVILEPNLHESMHYFLFMLSITDLGLTLSTMPMTLSVLWFNAPQEISLNTCIAQMFFLHGFTFIESGVLLAMAFDRFVIICDPLRYTTIFTNARIAKIGISIILLVPPLPFTLKRLRYCNRHLLSHSYCLHQDVMKLACSDNRANFYYGLFVVLCMMSDSVFIAISYVFILKTVLGIASRGGAINTCALNTCVSHICAVLIFYVPLIGVSVIHRFGKHLSPLTHALMANAYLVVPPVLNHIVYTVKTKEIQRKIFQMFVETKITAEG
uniref:Olfactory receptor n=1 Tax=Theropithecus gelada TaxID=9565 RepID=A0A8D2G1R3_THEGE